MRKSRLVAWGFMLFALATNQTLAADAFSERATVTAKFDPPAAKPGQTVTWIMRMELKGQQYHSYPTKQFDPHPDVESLVTKIVKPQFGELVPVGDVIDPDANLVPHDGHMVRWVEGSGEWKMTFVVHPKATPGKKAIQLGGFLTVCDDRGCTNSSPPPAEITILNEPVGSIEDKYSAEVSKFPLEKPAPKPPDPPRGADPVTPPPPSEGKRGEIAPPAATLEEHQANLRLIREQMPDKNVDTSSLWAFLGTAIFWGAVSLLTPCVFPMIPITVSFFLHQSANEHNRPLKLAVIYCGTIILVLGLAALLLLSFFRALSVHWATNIGLGLLFVFFALSLFGMYEIVLPQRLTAFTSQREGRGGVVGTIFMALTFTIVSFTCVAPFLGSFGATGGTASSRFSARLILGAFTFSATFASPFFVLALFPSLIKKLPQSGSWLNSVKVVMGFLELAAALKFFRTAELVKLSESTYFTYDLVLCIWVGLAAVCGLYLLGIFRLHHDGPAEHVGVMRMLLGLGFLAFGLYLLPGAFKSGGDNQRPRGVVFAWVDSFLLPEPSAAAAGKDEPRWSANLKGTVDLARQELKRTGQRQFILLDCTGVSCTNCRINEREVFPRPEVRQLVQQYWLVQHYTDVIPKAFYSQEVDSERFYDEAKANLEFQRAVFGTEQLPLYVTMEVTKDKVIVRGVYDEGKINDPAAFVKFLKDSRQ